MKNTLAFYLLIGLCLLTAPSLAQLPDINLFEARLHIEGNDTLPYRLYRSEKALATMRIGTTMKTGTTMETNTAMKTNVTMEPNAMMETDTIHEALPLVIFLHGAGERGNDNIAQIKHIVRYFLQDSVTSRYPFLLMAPQCPVGKRWVNTNWSLPEHQMEPEPTAALQGVFTLMDSLIDSGTVDAKHVYICGLSMGGFGVWDALQRQPQRFAAAIAICGGGDPAYAHAMKDIPIHIFHGMKDPIVMPSRSIQMCNALRKAGNRNALLVTYPELGHGCWDEALSTPGIFQWLFGF